MVGSGEGDDKFTLRASVKLCQHRTSGHAHRTLYGFADGDTLAKKLGINQRDDLEEEVWLRGEQVRHEFLHGLQDTGLNTAQPQQRLRSRAFSNRSA